jgi:hypothetical protein
MKMLLLTDLGEDISLNRIHKILKKEKIFIIHQKPIRKIIRRKFDVRFYGEVCQSDLAYMFPWDKYLYFLLLVDCFSLKVFTQPLKSKESASIKIAFEKIIEDFKGTIHVLQTDKGGEFIGCRQFFKEKKIVFKTKTGNNKASYAENFIYQMKKRLYMMLRGNLTRNWVKYLPIIVNQYNNTPNDKLGGLTPNHIHSEFDSVLVTQLLRKKHIVPYQEKNFHEQIKAEKAFTNDKKNIQINDYVYISTQENQFSKSYDTKEKQNSNQCIKTFSVRSLFKKKKIFFCNFLSKKLTILLHNLLRKEKNIFEDLSLKKSNHFAS